MTEQGDARSPEGVRRDGFAAVGVALLTVALIVFVVIKLV